LHAEQAATPTSKYPVEHGHANDVALYVRSAGHSVQLSAFREHLLHVYPHAGQSVALVS